ncbi:MAG: substrate-binding domain-containing protein [Turicibacter sp.]|nr:substrate-binding domain-containing protein [Turicibacter sp.]
MKKLLIATALAVFAACGGDFAADREINIISREEGSGTRGAFVEMLGIEVTDADGTRDLTAPQAEIANGTNMVITAVSGNQHAISYISLGTLNNDVRTVNIDGVAATTENVLNGSYPLFRTFELAVQDDLSAAAAEFIDFILSAEGQNIAAERGYITVYPNPPSYTASGESGTVVVVGSTSVAPLMERLIEAFQAVNANITVQMQISGSSAGITAAINGTADIGMTSRPLRETEAEQVNSVHIANDGLVVIVNNDNPLENLTQDEVRRIFIGEIDRWGHFLE